MRSDGTLDGPHSGRMFVHTSRHCTTCQSRAHTCKQTNKHPQEPTRFSGEKTGQQDRSCKCGIFRSIVGAEAGRSRGRSKLCVWPRHARCCSPEKILELLRVKRLVVGVPSHAGLVLEGDRSTWRDVCCSCAVLEQALLSFRRLPCWARC